MAHLDPGLKLLLTTLKKTQFEDNIPYMYVDTVGKITVGVGHNLSFHKDQKKLPFVIKRFKRHRVLGGDVGVSIQHVGAGKATPEEIQNDFDFLTRHSGLGKYHASQLQKYTTVELGENDIDELFWTDVERAIKTTRSTFPKLDSYPVSCQAALIDIAFNAGSFNSFQPHFVPAVLGTGQFAKKSFSQRWDSVILYSRRGQCSEFRNVTIAQWLKDGQPKD